MNQFLTLEQAKLHLRVDHDDDDSDIQALIDASFIAFEEVTNRKLYEQDQTIPDEVKNGISVNPSIIQGAKLLIGHWYQNRETTGNSQNLPFATEWLWSRHRFINVG